LRQTASKRRENILDVIERLRELKSEYPKLSAIPRQLAKVFKALNDNGTAIVEIREALAIDPDQIQLLILLARYLHDERDYLGAIAIYSKVRDLGGWDLEAVGLHTARYSYNGYLLALMYARENQRILDETNNWRELGQLSDLAGAFRARAWKRSVELSGDVELRAKALNKAVLILEELHKMLGYTEWFPGFFQEVIRGIVDSFKVPAFSASRYAPNLLAFVDFHITSVFADAGEDFENVLSMVGSLSRAIVADNPFRTLDWSDFLRTRGGHSFVNEEARSALLRDGYTIAVVYHKPSIDSPFAFARDRNDAQYFIHFQSLHADSRHLWRRVVDGAEIALRADVKPPLSGKAIPAVESIVL
jgi:tetratricopeptide (TPR) repeat protein